MAIECKRQILWGNAAPVVLNAEPIKSAPFNGDGDGGGTSVQTVLDEFLDNLGRAFHDFACCDEPDGRIVELANPVRFHGTSSKSCLSA